MPQLHIGDRFAGRWDRFSWFGVFSVADEEGSLLETPCDGKIQIDLSTLIVTMEALLIEGLEPPQNRKRGDDFFAIEFLQGEDPAIRKRQHEALLTELMKNVAS
ncbi:MAG: hypothetical protein JW384_01326 [Nitrosomonadaceae bacterium]|nr:hypothetical protein [Nitrosomonadaceae bacterium]